MGSCQIELLQAGKAYPRTCPTCGLSGACVKGLRAGVPDRNPTAAHGAAMTDLDAAKAMLEGVTAGPWEANSFGDGFSSVDAGHIEIAGAEDANARFIAAARDLVPALIAQVEQLNADLVSVLQRESATTARYDARLEAAETDLAAAKAREVRMREAGMDALAALVSARDTIRKKTGATNPAREAAIAVWCDILGVEVVPAIKETTDAR